MKWGAQGWVLTPEQAAADPLPMGVADMDLRAPQPVIDALVAPAQDGVFGYPNGASASHVRAVTDWQARRSGWKVAPDWVVQSAGIITAGKTIVQGFTSPGDTVLIQPPV
jgi:cystathionine beta-lyase